MWPSLAFIAHVFTQYNKLQCIYSLKELFFKIIIYQIEPNKQNTSESIFKETFHFLFSSFFFFFRSVGEC